MARSLFVYIATYLMCVNIAFAVINLVDDVFLFSNGTSLFGNRIEPYIKYDTIANPGGNQTFNTTNKDDMITAANQAASYGPQAGISDASDFWFIVKNSVLAVINIFLGVLVGLPLFIWKVVPELCFVLSPILGMLGVIQVIGMLEIIKGTSL
jgi:hypothetical protein